MINRGRGSVGYKPGPFPKDLDRLGGGPDDQAASEAS